MKRMGWFLFLFLLFTWNLQAAEPLRLESGAERWVLDAHLEVLTDPTRQITFAQIQQGHLQTQFKDNLGGPPSPGFTENYYWLRFRLENQQAKQSRFLLEFAETAVDFFEVYLPMPGGGYRKVPGGDLLKVSQRELFDNKFLFPLHIPPGQAVEVYLHMQSGYAVMPLVLHHPDAFKETNDTERLVVGMALGVILALAIYNLILYLGIRDATFITYGLYHFSVALQQSVFNGNAQLYLWPENPWLANHMMTVGIYLMLLFALLFTNQFLSLRERMPRLHLFQMGGVAYSAVMILVSLAMPVNLSVQIATISAIFLVGLVAWGILACLFQGVRQARFMALAWAVFLVGGVIYALRGNGLTPVNWFTNHAMHLGMVLEALLLSWALSDRISILRREKEQSDQEALAAQRKLTQELEAQVSARTTELSQKNRDLELANETKDQFFSILAHDLRGPMGSLSVIFNEVVKEPKDLEPELLHHIQSATGNLHQLLEDLLTWARSQKGQLEARPKEFDLVEAAREQLDLLLPALQQKGVRLKQELPPHLYVYADPAMTRTVLRNLLGNALKFTPRGAEVSLRLRQQGAEVLVEVEDSGVGMDAETQAKLFQLGGERSSPGTDNEPGTGLGLLLCKEFVDQNQGQIGAQSELGVGSRFWFTLPWRPRREESPKRPSFSGLRILLAEDNPLHRETSAKVLSDLGLNFETAANGLEALNSIQAGGIDLVLLDIDMPTMTGIEVAQEVQTLDQRPCLVVLSSYSKEELTERAEGLGFAGYLNKPLRAEPLLDLLSETLA